MNIHQWQDILLTPPDWKSDDGDASFWMLDNFNKGDVWLGRYCGESDWTCHPAGDVLVHTLSGEVRLTLHYSSGDEEFLLREGDIMVIPANTWYRNQCDKRVVQWGTTLGETLHLESLAEVIAVESAPAN